MSRNDGFLARWSRRKLETAVERAERPAEPAAPDAIERSTPEGTPAGPPAPGPLPPEAELAALPRIEDLTAGSDVTPFLRAGVPSLLRNAALRRMWSLDPAIRDFVGEARDYSYDWNVAGGVPVSGPLVPDASVRDTLDRMFSRLSSDPEPESPAADEPPHSAERPIGEAGVASADLDRPPTDDDEDVKLPDPASAGVVVLEASDSTMAEPLPLQGSERPDRREPARPLPRRRHGAALPKLD